MGEYVQNITNEEQQLSAVLNAFLSVWANHDAQTTENNFANELLFICRQEYAKLFVFPLDEQSALSAMHELENGLLQQCPSARPLAQSVSYLLDEIICNMQQHSMAKEGIGYVTYNADIQTIDVILADDGISIYGSYVNAQKYLNLIGNSDAGALNLAKDGYSTKNLPNAENRGYGLSSNAKMVVDGLKGQFGLFSGNALYLKTVNDKKIIALPDGMEWKGTIVMARIPLSIPENYNFYDYIA